MNILKKICLPIILVSPFIFALFYIKANVSHLSFVDESTIWTYIYLAFSVIIPFVLFLVSYVGKKQFKITMTVILAVIYLIVYWVPSIYLFKNDYSTIIPVFSYSNDIEEYLCFDKDLKHNGPKFSQDQIEKVKQLFPDDVSRENVVKYSYYHSYYFENRIEIHLKLKGSEKMLKEIKDIKFSNDSNGYRDYSVYIQTDNINGLYTILYDETENTVEYIFKKPMGS